MEKLNHPGYFAAQAELDQTVTFYRGLPKTLELLTQQIVTAINVDPELFQPLLTDIFAFAEAARQINLQATSTINGQTYISADAHRFLTEARTIGLIPLRVTRALKDHPVISLGASVASSALDLLVSHGAENITVVDGGLLAPSNMPRMPYGAIDAVGQPKATFVSQLLLGRNPFLSVNVHEGRAILDENERSSERDVTFSQLFHGHANPIIIEAIDHPATKIALRRWLRANMSEALILMPTDVGHKPFVSAELGSDSPMFNQPDFDPDKADPTNLLRTVFSMVESGFPPDHRAQFLAIAAGLMSSWSQLPTSARESAAIATKLALLFLRDGSIAPGIYRYSDLPETLMPYSNSDLGKILGISQAFFSPSP